MFDGILHLARTGCQWRMLPTDFPSFTTVEGYFYDWRDDGLFEKINFALLLQARDVAGREASLSAGISPPVRHSVSNGPSLREAPARFGNWIVETVKRAADAAGFQLLPRRWVVERTPRLAPIETAAWARDFEASIASKAWVYITSVQLLIRRL